MVMSREYKNGITQEFLRERFTYCPTGRLLWRANRNKKLIGKKAGCLMKDGRTVVSCKNTAPKATYLLHRLIWIYHNGDIPELVDHKNRNHTDHRIENLRLASRKQNNLNADRVRGNTKYRGVFRTGPNRLTAQLTIDGKKKHIGSFKCETEAAKAVDAYAYENFTKDRLEFYLPNFPDERIT